MALFASLFTITPIALVGGLSLTAIILTLSGFVDNPAPGATLLVTYLSYMVWALLTVLLGNLFIAVWGDKRTATLPFVTSVNGNAYAPSGRKTNWA